MIVRVFFFLLIVVTFYGCKNENLEISHPEYIFGLDVSHYQGNIKWTLVQESHHPI